MYGRTHPFILHPIAVVGLWPVRPQWERKARPRVGVSKWPGGLFGLCLWYFTGVLSSLKPQVRAENGALGQGLVVCPGWFPSHLIPSPQERFQVKNPPAAYIQKLKSYLETGGVSRKVAADWMSNLGVHASPFFSVPFTLYLLSSGQLE